MPRVSQKRECRHCTKPIDIRGFKVHELTCKQRPAEESSDIGQVDVDRKHDNLRVMMDLYREGLRDGFQFAKKAA